ncbi:MAG: hypothetical protein MHM6MM_006364 [Cercozoa sp. M6MM]
MESSVSAIDDGAQVAASSTTTKSGSPGDALSEAAEAAAAADVQTTDRTDDGINDDAGSNGRPLTVHAEPQPADVPEPVQELPPVSQPVVQPVVQPAESEAKAAPQPGESQQATLPADVAGVSPVQPVVATVAGVPPPVATVVDESPSEEQLSAPTTVPAPNAPTAPSEAGQSGTDVDKNTDGERNFTPMDENGRRRCTYCSHSETPTWRCTKPLDKLLCNACYMYAKRHGSLRGRRKNWYTTRPANRQRKKRRRAQQDGGDAKRQRQNATFHAKSQSAGNWAHPQLGDLQPSNISNLLSLLTGDYVLPQLQLPLVNLALGLPQQNTQHVLSSLPLPSGLDQLATLSTTGGSANVSASASGASTSASANAAVNNVTDVSNVSDHPSVVNSHGATAVSGVASHPHEMDASLHSQLLNLAQLHSPNLSAGGSTNAIGSLNPLGNRSLQELLRQHHQQQQPPQPQQQAQLQHHQTTLQQHAEHDVSQAQFQQTLQHHMHLQQPIEHAHQHAHHHQLGASVDDSAHAGNKGSNASGSTGSALTESTVTAGETSDRSHSASDLVLRLLGNDPR